MADDLLITHIGIVGFGMIGQIHFRAYEGMRKGGLACCVCAVCDEDEGRRRGEVVAVGNMEVGDGERLFLPGEVRGYGSVEELLADESVDAVSVCTHTGSHVDICIQALKAGKHVLVEKPIALTVREVKRLVEAAGAHPDLIVMPAMCMRYWPGWSWLKERVVDGEFGRIRSATFHRLGTSPGWSSDFYDDFDRSGGALLDLHIHDVDFIRYVFGEPESVSSCGNLLQLTTLYYYGDDGPDHVVAEGSWGQVEGFPFQMRYLVNFELATAEFDSRRGSDALHLYQPGKGRKIVGIEAGMGYDFEVAHFVDLVRGEASKPRVTADDALAVMRVIEAERASLRMGGCVCVSE